MGVPYVLKKQYINHLGLDLKSSDLVRDTSFSSGMTNAQYRKNGTIEKRKGFQPKAQNTDAGGFGLYAYNRDNPTDGSDAGELVAFSDKLHRVKEATITVTYSGAEPTSNASMYFDPTDDEYKFELIAGPTTELSQGLGKGVDEGGPYTLTQLDTAINALAFWSSTLSGEGSTAAAFLDIKRPLSTATLSQVFSASHLEEVNSTISTGTPFVGSETNKLNDNWENIAAVQLKNNMYISNGYDEVHKYDGQTVYRAGLTEPDDPVATLIGAAGAVKFKWKAQFKQIDANGIITEANISDESNEISLLTDPSVANVDIDFDCIEHGTGFNTNGAIVAGGQTGTTITVDNGSGGSIDSWKRLRDGDTAYFFDTGTSAYREVEVTASTGTSVTFASSITVADNTVISNNLRIIIYRTTGDTSNYFIVEEIPNDPFNATFTYRDTNADPATITGIELIEPLTDRSPPPKSKYITAFREQLFFAGDFENQNTVYQTEPEDSPEYYDSTGAGAFDVNTIYGDKITGIAPNNNVLAIFLERSISVLSGNVAEKDFRVDQLTLDIGCAAHATIQEVRGDLFFLSDRGPYVMTGGNLPRPVADDRIEPIFDQGAVDADETFVLNKAVAVNDRDEEKYVLILPTFDASSSDVNENFKVIALDYTRDAWLEWNNMNIAGGAAVFRNQLYWVNRGNQSATPTLWRKMDLGDVWDYQDHDSAIDFTYKSQWESLNEPSVLKKFLRVRLFALEIDGQLDLDIKTEVNYTSDTVTDEFSLVFGADGYGVSPYGTYPYGDPFENVIKHRLSRGRFRSLRLIFENSSEQQNVVLTG